MIFQKALWEGSAGVYGAEGCARGRAGHYDRERVHLENGVRGLVPEKMIDERIADLLPRAEKSRRGIEDGGGYLVGEDDGTVVGFCMYGDCRNEAYPGAGEVYALYVLAGYQGRGAGRALFAAAAGELKARGFPCLVVNCLRGNPALRFYERMGGAVVAGARTIHPTGR
jgi:GNAT superfamily N-acetyltransferase